MAEFTQYVSGASDLHSLSMFGLYWVNKRWISGGGTEPPESELQANLRVFYILRRDDECLYIQIKARGRRNDNDVSTEIGKGL
jgi:hypothetical protein